MKRKAVLFGCILCLILLCSCHKPIQSNTDKMGDTTMMTLTATEVKLMTAVYGEQERMESGNLLDHHVQALQQLRAGVAYLEKKYPQNTPEVATFTPTNAFHGAARFLLEDRGVNYTMTVTPTEDGYVCADNYYGAFLRVPYDQYVCRVLKDRGYTAQSYTDFSALLGEEVDGKTSVEAFLKAAPKASRVTHIFVKDSAALSATDAVQTALQQSGLYGAYSLYEVPDAAYTTSEDMMAHKSAWRYVTFQCFDIA